MVALILGFLALRHVLAQDRSRLFLILLGICGLQSLVVSLVQHYGVSGLAMLQPILASFIPPIAWLTFQSAALGPIVIKRDGLHLVPPAFLTFCVIFAPLTLDVMLTLIFVAYGVAILFRLRRGEVLPLARFESGPLPVLIWKAIGILLLLSALSDVLIAAALALGHVSWRPVIISLFTSFTLLGIGCLSLSREAEGAAEVAPVADTPEGRPEASVDASSEAEEYAALIARLDAVMAEGQLYLDPDLTLSRLARKLHVPIKQLSVAINMVKGENVSRYVNGFRIRNACARLKQGDSVTEAMLGSGFNTKSNFNREFARVMGQAPSAFLRSEAAKPS